MYPQRIVSLVPSQTELLYYLGLGDRVVGITKFCIHPEEWFHNKTRVGGTKNIDLEKLLSLKPDLVIANKEENIKEQVEAITNNNIRVWVSDVVNLDDTYTMIHEIGSLTGCIDKAAELNKKIKKEFDTLYKHTPSRKVAYLIWKNPYITVGHDTFIHDMLARCGFQNVYANKTRYPSTSVEELKLMGADIIMLSSEPYPFKEKHIEDLQEELPGTKIMLVDGEMFSWYGSRLLQAASYFKRMISTLY